MTQPVYALNLFNVANRDEYLSHSRSDPKLADLHPHKRVYRGRAPPIKGAALSLDRDAGICSRDTRFIEGRTGFLSHPCFICEQTYAGIWSCP
jgi:hypothetical protein